MACIVNVEVAGTKGVACRNTNQCFFGMTCRSGQCAPSRVGDTCVDDFHCPSSSRCGIRQLRGQLTEIPEPYALGLDVMSSAKPVHSAREGLSAQDRRLILMDYVRGDSTEIFSGGFSCPMWLFSIASH